MSKLEEKVKERLIKCFSDGVEEQPEMSITPPWFKTNRKPKADFSVSVGDSPLFIEVKGLMTIEAMTKMLWFCKQDFPYYVIQIGEKEDDWLTPFEFHMEELLVYLEVLISKDDEGRYFSNIFSEQRIKNFFFSRVNKMLETLNEEWEPEFTSQTVSFLQLFEDNATDSIAKFFKPHYDQIEKRQKEIYEGPKILKEKD